MAEIEAATDSGAVGDPKVDEDVEESSQEFTLENEDGTTTTVMRQTKKVTRTVKQTVIQSVPVERETRIQIIRGSDGNYYYEDESGQLKPAQELGIPLDQLNSSFGTTESTSYSDHIIQSRLTKFVAVDEFGNSLPDQDNIDPSTGLPVGFGTASEAGNGSGSEAGVPDGWHLADTKVEVTLLPMDGEGGGGGGGAGGGVGGEGAEDDASDDTASLVPSVTSDSTLGVVGGGGVGVGVVGMGGMGGLPCPPGGVNYIPVDVDGNPIDPNSLANLPLGLIRYMPVDAQGNVIDSIPRAPVDSLQSTPQTTPRNTLPRRSSDLHSTPISDQARLYGADPSQYDVDTPIKDTLDDNYGLRDSIAPHLRDGAKELDALMQRNVIPTFDRATPTSGLGRATPTSTLGRATPNGYYTPQRIASPSSGMDGVAASPYGGSYQYYSPNGYNNNSLERPESSNGVVPGQRYAPQPFNVNNNSGAYNYGTPTSGPISGYPIYVKHGIAPLAPAESWADVDMESLRSTPLPSNRTSLAVSETSEHPLALGRPYSPTSPYSNGPYPAGPGNAPAYQDKRGHQPPVQVSPIAEEPNFVGHPSTPMSLSTQADDRSMASTAEPPSTPLDHPNSTTNVPINGVVGDDDDDGSDLYRDPTLAEVIDYLKDERQPQVQANAAAYLQHLMYKNEDLKNECRTLGGVDPLLQCANGTQPQQQQQPQQQSQQQLPVRKNALKALKNLSHRDRAAPDSTDENKRAIKAEGGIPKLADVIKNSEDPQEVSLAAAVLWNLSACEDLKENILDDPDAIPHIVDGLILPKAKYAESLENPQLSPSGLPTTDEVLKNSLGVLRNVSSTGGRDPKVRTRLRDWNGLIESLIRIIKSAIADSNLQPAKDDEQKHVNEIEQPINDKVVENCACTLRNLSYRTQEIKDGAEFDQEEEKEKSKENITSSKTDVKEKKKKKTKEEEYSCTKADPVGVDLLWHSDTVQMYVTLLDHCLNATTLAAAGGALQNLCACTWKPSVEIRSLIRRKMALPIIVDLLLLQDERAVCAMTWALRNLIAGDETNRSLVGKYGVGNLAALLPPSAATAATASETTQQQQQHAEETIFAALSTIAEVVHKNKAASQEFIAKDGLVRTIAMTKTKGKYTEKTLKMAALVLRRLWLIKSLHKTYKSSGFTQDDFHVTSLEVAKSPEDSAFNQRNDTLFRQNKPSQSDDATLKKARKKKPNQEEEIEIKGGAPTKNGDDDPGETSV